MKQPHRQSSLRIARELLTDNFKYFLLVWLLVFLIVTCIITGIALYSEPSESILDNAVMAPRYWLLTAGIILTAACLRLYISHGVTRRQFIGGGSIAGVVACLGLAVLMAAAYYAESAVYESFGWNYELTGPHLFTGGDQFVLVMLEFWMVFTAHFFAGWVMGSLFARLNVWVALPLVVVAYIGAAAVEAVLGTSWSGRILVMNLEWSTPTLPWTIGIGMLLIGALALANQRLLRDVAIGNRAN